MFFWYRLTMVFLDKGPLNGLLLLLGRIAVLYVDAAYCYRGNSVVLSVCLSATIVSPEKNG